MSEPDITKKKRRRRSARVYINVHKPVNPEAAALIADFPGDDDDAPTPQHSRARAEVGKRDVGQAERRQLASEGRALPNLSYPVKTHQDAENALAHIRLGHGDVKEAKRMLRRVARKEGWHDIVDALDGKEPAKKSYFGEALPAATYAQHRVSEPLTDGRASTATGDHGVGQGRNPGLAAHHPDLRQSSPAAFDALGRLQTVRGDLMGEYAPRLGGFSHMGEVALNMFNSRGEAGRYGGMNTVNPDPQRPDHHRAANSATPPNGGHSLAQPEGRHPASMKNSELHAEFKRLLFPGSGGGR